MVNKKNKKAKKLDLSLNLSNMNKILSNDDPIVIGIVIMSNNNPNNKYGVLSLKDCKQFRKWQLVDIYKMLKKLI